MSRSTCGPTASSSSAWYGAVSLSRSVAEMPYLACSLPARICCTDVATTATADTPTPKALKRTSVTVLRAMGHGKWEGQLFNRASGYPTQLGVKYERKEGARYADAGDDHSDGQQLRHFEPLFVVHELDRTHEGDDCHFGDLARRTKGGGVGEMKGD